MLEEASSNDLLTRQVEIILENNAKRLLSEIAKVHSEIACIKEDVAELKRRRPVATPTPSPPPLHAANPALAEPVAAGQQAPVQAPPQAAPQAQATGKPIDRNGVAPSDVSIDKIFYYGQK